MKKLHKIIIDGKLIGRYLSGTTSGNQLWSKIKNWLDEDSRNIKTYKKLQDEERLADVLDEFDLFDEEKAWLRFTSKKMHNIKKSYIRWSKIAAVFLFVIGLSSILIYNYSNKEHTKTIADFGEIETGGPKAYLELTNGSVINLAELTDAQKEDLKNSFGFDVIENTVIARKSKTLFTKKENLHSQLNILIVPKGGEYKMVLEDSTEVWLNADSKLKFPQKFSSNMRHVELIGEAYFKVKKDKHRPFIVKSNEMDIRVLGTEFNISAYSNDPLVKTTLVNGLVTISYESRGVKGQQNLYPGDQVLLNRIDNIIHIETVDLVKYVAWKDGYFVFENQSLEEVVRILGRWYNVEFAFQNEDLKNTRFSGQFLRYDNINVVFDILRKTGTKININKEGNTIKMSIKKAERN